MPRLYEWTATIESGLSLELDKPSQRWRGHRIRYRRQGERRWRSFLLSLDTGLTPSDADVIRAIEAHEEHTAGGGASSRKAT